MGVVRKNIRAGELEPLAFLHVWRDTPPAPDTTHRLTPVPREPVLAYLAEHQAELQALANVFLTP